MSRKGKKEPSRPISGPSSHDLRRPPPPATPAAGSTGPSRNDGKGSPGTILLLPHLLSDRRNDGTISGPSSHDLRRPPPPATPAAGSPDQAGTTGRAAQERSSSCHACCRIAETTEGHP
ncbi:hypothetical protein BDA96_01G278600 [Sorghum bicolor]|uniref:Uncharacterized protein n=1 Tax=Sorghum bicolor TaxID=4558 RepID=A0A921UZM8_SORBI|nr:hypothetical protein BDA96_01G278600 [Sorghum bicolor]